MSATPEYLLSTLRLLPEEQRASLERELLPLARAAALGELTADIGHDLANPLFAVIGHIDLLLAGAVPGSPEEQRLRLIKETALELKEGLGEILGYTRLDDRGESAALDEAARAAAELVRHGFAKELQIAATYPAEPVIVRCPPDALGQAALHLVAAARAVAGDAGPIEIQVTSDGVLRVRPAAAGGIGIVAAARIAADNGGSLEQDGKTLSLRLPLWVAS
jgi:signal transduction histidine kinase